VLWVCTHLVCPHIVSLELLDALSRRIINNLTFHRATTLNEYRTIEKDVALARRFQPIQVNEPTIQDTISILRGIKEKYEVHHGVRITDVCSPNLELLFSSRSFRINANCGIGGIGCCCNIFQSIYYGPVSPRQGRQSAQLS
jgi:hypothetical protein